MIVRYLIDTDWAIHWLNGHPEVVRRLEELQPEGLGLSVISLAELYEGIYYSTDPDRNQRVLSDFLRAVPLIGIDEETCRIFGKERGRLRAAGKSIGDFDLLIGTTALPARSYPTHQQPAALRDDRGPPALLTVAPYIEPSFSFDMIARSGRFIPGSVPKISWRASPPALDHSRS